MGIKGGIVIYHIGYGTTLGCLVISGVKWYYQPRFRLTNVGWINKPDCDRICEMGTPACIIVMFIVVGGKKVLSFFSLIALIYHPQKDNFWIHVQFVNNTHMLL
jgi:hypothetical protein